MIHWKVRRETTLRPIITTQTQADQLARLYLQVLAVWSNPRILDAYRRTLSEMTTDSVSDIEVEIEATQGEAVRAIFSFRWLFSGWLDRLVTWHTKKLISNLLYATNIDLTSIIGPAPQDTVQATIARNVALVTNISDQARQRISDAIYRGLTQRLPAREVAKEINAALALGRARSIRIAGDQLTKASAALDTSRANDLDLFKWKWDHSGKVHFRPEHKARDGKMYDDRKLPPEIRSDQPGFAPFCGCRKRYVID